MVDWQIYSAVPGLNWPAMPGPDAVIRLALQYQLEQSQWLPAERLRELQFVQLEVMLKHAYDSVPYYRQAWQGEWDPARILTPERFVALPLLTRRNLQDAFENLKSRDVPAAHGVITEARTSGSTGAPVKVLKTLLCGLLWQVTTLRDHLWRQRDLGGKLAVIRHGATPGEFPGWGLATDGLTPTGPMVARGVAADVEDNLTWLAQHQPDYLTTHPSLAAELARASLSRGVSLPRLREVRTFGELLAPETRQLCRDAWDAPVTDTYSTSEVGYIALQCPVFDHYHVQSEGVLVEILDDGGRICAPGEVGRIVVTTLHNFAMPLVRYDIGDYAEVGAPCACGRGLPVLRRIIGRVRNMLVTATGERYWPALGTRSYADIAPVRQCQLVQKQFDLIEVRLVTDSALTAEQEDGLRRLFTARLPAGLHFNFVYCDAIARSAGGKFEDFISEVATAPG